MNYASHREGWNIFELLLRDDSKDTHASKQAIRTDQHTGDGADSEWGVCVEKRLLMNLGATDRFWLRIEPPAPLRTHTHTCTRTARTSFYFLCSESASARERERDFYDDP